MKQMNIPLKMTGERVTYLRKVKENIKNIKWAILKF